jgi:predicted CXXCH cytochrome family protein
VAAGAGAALFWWWARPAPPATTVAAHQDTDGEEAPARAPGYLGPQACAPCHSGRVAQFKGTSHFRACRVARPGDVPLGFTPGKGKYVPVQLRPPGAAGGAYARRDPALRIEMTQEGDELLQTVIRTTAAGEERTTARIDLVYGAGTGTADEVFHTWHDDGLYELPMGWLHPQKKWGNSSINPYGSTGDLSRATTPRCVECHNTWFEHVPGTRSQYKRDGLVLGVTCESCHGPGRDHVAFHQANPENQLPHAIVRPAFLTRERKMDLCAQCHSNAINHRGPAFSYRPGEPLEKHYKAVTPRYPENDHVANQGKYLRQSKCFQKSDTMTCLTCHNPHRREGPGHNAAVQRSCLKCHKPAACREQERLPQAVRGNCVGCHMPARVWMNVHFHTDNDEYVPPIRRHQHRIAVYPTARQEVLLAWHRQQSDAHSRQEADRLTEALVKHWLAEAENRRRDHRFLAAIGAIREALHLRATPALREKLREAVAVQARIDANLVLGLHQIDRREFSQASATLEKLLAVKPDHAVAHGKLGTAYANIGQKQKAIEHWQAVARSDPDSPYGSMMLAWLAYSQGNTEEALGHYRRADEVEPFNAKTHYHWGVALAKLGRTAEAGDHFRQVLTIDPKHAGGCQGLSHALRQQGQPEEALRLARRAARLTDFKSPDVLLTLALALADTGNFAEAEKTAARALELAQTSAPDQAPDARRVLEDVRGRAGEAGKSSRSGWGLVLGWLWSNRGDLAFYLGLALLAGGLLYYYSRARRARERAAISPSPGPPAGASPGHPPDPQSSVPAESCVPPP